MMGWLLRINVVTIDRIPVFGSKYGALVWLARARRPTVFKDGPISIAFVPHLLHEFPEHLSN